MFKNSKRIVDTGTWAAAIDLAAIDLPREGLITEVIIRAVITATLTATAEEDTLRRVINSLSIRGDGGRTYLGLSGGDQLSRLLAYVNKCDHGGEFSSPAAALTTIDVGSTAFEQSFIFHPGSNPLDPFDLSAAIPAKALSTLQLFLSTTAAAVTDAAGAITAGTFRYTINQVLDMPVPAGLMCPLGSLRGWANDANYTDYGYEIDVPGGAWLKRIWIMCQDETAIPIRKNDQIAAVRLRLPKAANKEVAAWLWRDLLVESAKNNRLNGWSGEEAAIGAVATTRPGLNSVPHIPVGLAMIDLRKFAGYDGIFHPVYGMNLTNFQTGDVKLGLTVENRAAGDDTYVYWEQLQPVEAQYVCR